MRYVDADKLLQQLPNDLPYKGSVKRVLIQAPAEDVVEVEKVAEMFAEQIGDFPCNVNDNAEWLSILEDCDCNCSMKCWEKFVKHYGKRK